MDNEDAAINISTVPNTTAPFHAAQRQAIQQQEAQQSEPAQEQTQQQKHAQRSEMDQHQALHQVMQEQQPEQQAQQQHQAHQSEPAQHEAQQKTRQLVQRLEHALQLERAQQKVLQQVMQQHQAHRAHRDQQLELAREQAQHQAQLQQQAQQLKLGQEQAQQPAQQHHQAHQSGPAQQESLQQAQKQAHPSELAHLQAQQQAQQKTMSESKKAKRANLIPLILKPPQPFHQLQSDMDGPVKIPVVPNNTAPFLAGPHQTLEHQHQQLELARRQAYQQAQQQQQQIFSSMSLIPSNIPIRSTTAPPAPLPQQQSHREQFLQLLLGTNPHGTPQTVPQGIPQEIPNSLQLQETPMQQILRAARARHADMVASDRQTPTLNPATGPTYNFYDLNQLLQTTDHTAVEIDMITQIMRDRGQMIKTDDKQFSAHLAQADAEARAIVTAARMENARNEALMKKQQKYQAAEEKVKAKTEARRKAAQEKAKAKQLEQAEARMRAQAAHTAQVNQAHRLFAEIRYVASTGQRLSVEQLQILQQLANMPQIVPMQDLEQIKVIIAYHKIMDSEMGAPKPPMPGMLPGVRPMPAPTPYHIDPFAHRPELLRQLQEGTLAQQQQMTQQLLPQGFNPQHLQQQMNMQQIMALSAALATPAPGNPAMLQPNPLQTLVSQQTPALAASISASVAVPVPVVPATPIQTPPLTQTPQSVQPDDSSDVDVEN